VEKMPNKKTRISIIKKEEEQNLEELKKWKQKIEKMDKDDLKEWKQKIEKMDKEEYKKLQNWANSLPSKEEIIRSAKKYLGELKKKIGIKDNNVL
jgi:hypothetical protein